MAYVFCHGQFFSCKNLFGFNPELVPSIRVNSQGQADPNGSKEPICASCIARVNPKRIANGLEPIHILPGAYDPQEVS